MRSTGSWLLTLAALAALAAAGCGDDAATSDAGADSAPPTDAGSDAHRITPPALPEAPTLTPCPDGWAEREVAGVTTCEPFPAGLEESCPSGQAQRPADVGCVAIGPACPSGDFADDAPTMNALFVLASAAPGGDGSRARPFDDLTMALDGATPGTTIVLGKGTYRGYFVVNDGVRILGACVAETILSADGPQVDGEFSVFGTRGADVVLERVSIRDTEKGAIVAGFGATLSIRDVFIDRVSDPALTVQGASRVTGQNVVVRDTQLQPGGTRGAAVELSGGATLSLSRSALVGSTFAAARAFGDGTQLIIEDSVVRGTRSSPRVEGNGFGVLSARGATATVTNTAVVDNRNVGLLAVEATLHADRVVSRSNREDAMSGEGGMALAVMDGARGSARRLLAEDSRDNAVAVYAARFEIEDLVVSFARSRSGDGGKGEGVHVRGGNLTLQRAVIEDVGYGGLRIDEASVVIADDVRVRDVSHRLSDETGGVGVALQDDSEATLARVFVERAQLAGILVDRRSMLVAQDITIIDSVPQTVDSAFGVGLAVQEGSSATVARLSATNNVAIGVMVGRGSTLAASDLLVRGAALSACADAGCPALGMGLASLYGGTATVTDFIVDDAVTCGVLVAEDGAADLSRGLIRGSEIGACVQVDGFDLDRVSADVIYEDNGVNLDYTSLPVPESLGAL